MLLDTSAYSALARGVESIVGLVRDASELYLPLPVIAELRYGFAKGSQPSRNEEVLQRFLAQPQVSIAMPAIKTTEHYAKLQFICQQKGRALSQNDLWIAALAQDVSLTLVTFDKDFEVLAPAFGDKLMILT